MVGLVEFSLYVPFFHPERRRPVVTFFVGGKWDVDSYSNMMLEETHSMFFFSIIKGEGTWIFWWLKLNVTVDGSSMYVLVVHSVFILKILYALLINPDH